MKDHRRLPIRPAAFTPASSKGVARACATSSRTMSLVLRRHPQCRHFADSIERAGALGHLPLSAVAVAWMDPLTASVSFRPPLPRPAPRPGVEADHLGWPSYPVEPTRTSRSPGRRLYSRNPRMTPPGYPPHARSTTSGRFVVDPADEPWPRSWIHLGTPHSACSRHRAT